MKFPRKAFSEKTHSIFLWKSEHPKWKAEDQHLDWYHKYIVMLTLKCGSIELEPQNSLTAVQGDMEMNELGGTLNDNVIPSEEQETNPSTSGFSYSTIQSSTESSIKFNEFCPDIMGVEG